jgi:ankyrin repeat protein
MNKYTMELCILDAESAFGGKIKRLIKKGADPNSVVGHDGSSLLMKHLDGHTNFKTLIKYDVDLETQCKKGETVLIRASKGIYSGFVKRLLAKGADPNKEDFKGRTALFYAAKYGCIENVELLLSHGANLHHQDHKGENALFYALPENNTSWGDSYKNTKDNSEMVQFLIEKGIAVNHKNKEGDIALFKYIKNEFGDEPRSKELESLVKSGADINIKNHKNETVLEIAVQYGFKKAVKLLLENGANIQDKEQNILTKIRKDNEHADKILKLLNKAGAKAYPFIAQYKTKFKCNACGRMIALNSPVEYLTCSSCQTINTIDEIIWKGLIDFSCFQEVDDLSVSYEGKNYLYIDMKRTVPICSNPECKSELKYKDLNGKTEAVLSCHKCGKEYLSLTTPDYLKAFDLKGLKVSRVISEEKETGKLEQKDFKTTAVQCVSCGANMSFTEDRPRLSTCEHCETIQYVTDSIWKTLHPYKIRKAWYIIYE